MSSETGKPSLTCCCDRQVYEVELGLLDTVMPAKLVAALTDAMLASVKRKARLSETILGW